MAHIGERAHLTVLREKPYGILLDGGELGEVLLPRAELPATWHIGGTVDVFLYTDSEDRPVATPRKPHILPGQVARLTCTDVTHVGAFLDWGLAKELLVPFREQRTRMQPGKRYNVIALVDPVTSRIIASTRISRQLDLTPHTFQPGDQVEIIVFGKTPLGYQAFIPPAHSGMIFANQVFQPISPGEKLPAWIANIRPDGKIDLTLRPPGRSHITTLEDRILAELAARGGSWAISDDSPPALIREELDCSKRAFKQALGALLKKGKVALTHKGIQSPEA